MTNEVFYPILGAGVQLVGNTPLTGDEREMIDNLKKGKWTFIMSTEKAIFSGSESLKSRFIVCVGLALASFLSISCLVHHENSVVLMFIFKKTVNKNIKKQIEKGLLSKTIEVHNSLS